MRTIKFRGQRVISGEWVYGYLFVTREDNVDLEKLIPCIQHVSMDDPFKWKTYMVDPETIGQFTGLKDKNGVEIYEGDCLHALRTRPSVSGQVVWVGSPEGRWGLEYEHNTSYSWSMGCSQWEVIGNVHESTELLNGE